MREKKWMLLAGWLFWLNVWNLSAQEKNFTISGNIRDKNTRENLMNAPVRIDGTGNGAVSDSLGHYSLKLAKGKYVLVISYIGYSKKTIPVELSADLRLNIDLESDTKELDRVVVSSEVQNDNVSKPVMSVERLSPEIIKSIPALMGEVDVIKAIQLLPGVQATSEGSSGFSVRGGGYDQNLILLDKAAVYSASHLMGFFSVFNNDAVKDVTLYKGDIPASYGGRLSSLLDVQTKDGNNQHFAVNGGIGLISSRLTIESPIGSKVTAIVSARRTYADLFLNFSSDDEVRGSTLYFYDVNAKVNYKIDGDNRVFLSGYFGRDKFGAKDIAGMNFGNSTLTAGWNHIFSSKLFSDITFIRSTYSYNISANLNEQTGEELKSGIDDYGLKADFNYALNSAHQIQFGYNLIYHGFHPADGGGTGDESMIGDLSLPKKYALENVLYITDEASLGSKLKLKYGLRYTGFGNLDNGSISYYQQQFEPRTGLTYLFNDIHSVKASYSRTTQFIQPASNSASGTPLDVWFPASKVVKPQKCDQFAVGYFRNFKSNRYELSAEVYYKNMKDAVDFKDHAQLLLNENLEGELLFGRGYAYGLELMLRKKTGALTGWISYTLSRSMRQIDGINDDQWYRSPYDRTHDISVVASYEISRKWEVSANWIYATGMPATYPTGRFLIENTYVPIYSGRNEYRYPAYHRLDLSATWKISSNKRFKHELNFSLYNAYGRKNAWTIRFRQEEDRPDVSYAEKVYLFTFVPSVTWNFSF